MILVSVLGPFAVGFVWAFAFSETGRKLLLGFAVGGAIFLLIAFFKMQLPEAMRMNSQLNEMRRAMEMYGIPTREVARWGLEFTDGAEIE